MLRGNLVFRAAEIQEVAAAGYVPSHFWKRRILLRNRTGSVKYFVAQRNAAAARGWASRDVQLAVPFSCERTEPRDVVAAGLVVVRRLMCGVSFGVGVPRVRLLL